MSLVIFALLLRYSTRFRY